MPAPAASILACPRCGRPTGPQFSGSGLCPACAAFSLLAQTNGGRTQLSPLPASAVGPEQIGPYQIIETLGTGGMGTVYLAQHRSLGRVVALKVIPLHGGGDRELRFQREARTVAALRHPHIITVHDAGHDAQHVYFAMDFVEGGDLATRLRTRPLAHRAAAELLAKVADAVAYSHAQDVLHRDLKPSNILLDGDEPRVADFGLAAPLETGGDLTRHTSVLGTPHYLAPEALLKGSAAQSPASDVYSLGVILYELLCGRLPYTAATPAELQQLIAATEPLAPRLLVPGLPRDLETICLKASATEPSRRYATAALLAGDLRRFLAGEPILARPLSAPSRLWRWARRRPQLAALWLLTFLLAASSTTAAWKINRARHQAETEATKSRALASFLQNDLLAQSSPSQQPDRDLKVRTLLDRTAEKIPGKFPGDPLTEAAVRATLATSYLSLGENAAAEAQLRRVATVRHELLGPDHRDTLAAQLDLATSLNRQAKNTEAAPLARTTAAALTRVLGSRDPAALHAMNALIDVELSLGRFAEAETLARETLAAARTALGAAHAETRTALTNLAATLWAQNKLAEAEPLNLASLAAHESALGPDHPETLAVKNNLATVLASHGRYVDAERLNREVLAARRRVLGPDHPESLRSLANLAFAVGQDGRRDEAATLYGELVAGRRRVLGPAHPDTFTAELSQAVTLGQMNRIGDALALLADLVSRADQALGRHEPNVLRIKRSYASALVAAQRPADAVPFARDVYDESLRQFGADDSRTILSGEALANALSKSGNFSGATELYRTMLASRLRTQPDNWRTHLTRGLLGQALGLAGSSVEAEAALRASYAALAPATSGLPGAQRRLLLEFAGLLAKIYAAEGRAADAADWAAKALPPSPAK